MPGENINPFNATNTADPSGFINKLLGEAVRQLSQQSETSTPAVAAGNIASQIPEEVLRAALHAQEIFFHPQGYQEPETNLDLHNPIAQPASPTPMARLFPLNDMPSPPEVIFPENQSQTSSSIEREHLYLPGTYSVPSESESENSIVNIYDIHPLLSQTPRKQAETQNTEAEKTAINTRSVSTHTHSSTSIELKPPPNYSLPSQTRQSSIGQSASGTVVEKTKANKRSARTPISSPTVGQKKPKAMTQDSTLASTGQLRTGQQVIPNAVAELATTDRTSARALPEGRPLQAAPSLPTSEQAERFRSRQPVDQSLVAEKWAAPNQAATDNRQQDNLETKLLKKQGDNI